MKVKVDKSFEKDTNKIHDSVILKKIALCIEQVISSDSIRQIQNLKKLQGLKYHYRI